MILANDDRLRTMHAEAERTDRELLPPLVGALLDRNDERRATRRVAATQGRSACATGRHERLTETTRDTTERAERERSVGGDSLELWHTIQSLIDNSEWALPYWDYWDYSPNCGM
jgi:hypothetical protein